MNNLHPLPTLLIADSQPCFAEPLSETLGENFRVVGTAGDASSALAMVQDLEPELVLMDTHMPGRCVFSVTDQISSSQQSRVLLWTSCQHESLLDRALDAGSSGLLSKQTVSPEMLTSILRRVLLGETHICPPWEKRWQQREQGLPPLEDSITEQQLDLLRLIAEGEEADQIAELLELSPSQVGQQNESLKRLLSARTDAEMVMRAFLQGVLFDEHFFS